MSEGDVSVEERNAYVGYKAGQNERKAQHHDESSQTLRLVRVGLVMGVVFALLGLSIYAFEKLEDKSDKLVHRSIDTHFYRTVSFELSANDRFQKSVTKLCASIDRKGEQRIEYAKKAHELGALATAHRLASGCNGDCKALVDSK